MLSYDYSKTLKFKRGQVWMVGEPESVSNAKVASRVGTICFTRPYVIISSDDVCAKESIIQGYPLTHSTTRPDGGIVFSEPAPSTEKSLILVNQLTPIESKNLLSYMYTLSSTLMDKIDRFTADRLGIPTMNDKIREMTEKIKSLEKELTLRQTTQSTPMLENLPKVEPINAYVGIVEDTPSNDAVSNISIEESTEPKKTEIPQKTPIFDPHYQLILYAKKVNHVAIKDQVRKPNNKIKIDINKYVDIFKSAIEDKAFSEPNLKICDNWIKERVGYSILNSTTRKRNRWTSEKKLQFLKDLENNELADILTKYNVKAKTIVNMKYIFKKSLKEEGLL